MFCNCLKCSFFFVHLFSKTKLEQVHCSETSLSGDCVYSKALTHLLTRTDVHFTTVDRTTEQTWLPGQRIQLHSQMNSSRSPMTVGIKSQRLLLQSQKFPSLCLWALTLSWPCHRWNTHTFVRSSAVLIGVGMRPAAATLRSAVRKLKVAHALGCKTSKRSTNWGSSAHLQITFSQAEPLFQSCGRNVGALPCLAPPQRCLSSWVERALTGRSAQGVHLCPAQGSLQENQGSKSNVPHLWSSCTTDSASNSPHQKVKWKWGFYLKLFQCLFHHSFYVLSWVFVFFLFFYLFLVQPYGKVRRSPLWCLYGCRPADVEKHRRKPIKKNLML